jgi:hypothetical protein
VDTGFHRDDFDAAYLIVEDGRAAFVDTGTNFSVPRLLGALDALGPARARAGGLGRSPRTCTWTTPAARAPPPASCPWARPWCTQQYVTERSTLQKPLAFLEFKAFLMELNL